jgi:hypothetical protein
MAVIPAPPAPQLIQHPIGILAGEVPRTAVAGEGRRSNCFNSDLPVASTNATSSPGRRPRRSRTPLNGYLSLDRQTTCLHAISLYVLRVWVLGNAALLIL